MKLAACVVVALVAAGSACACKGSKGGGTGPGTGGGSGSGSGGGDPAACEGQVEHVRALYAAASGQVEMTEAELGDNVDMVMKECRAAPAKVLPCLAKVTAVAQLESQCLPALDDEGREGQVFLDR